MKSIAVDMDEVVADLLPKYHTLYEAHTGRRAADAELAGTKYYHLPDAPPMRDALHERGFFRDLPVMAGAREGLEFLRQHYRLYFVTAAMEFATSFEDKYHWLHEHFPWVHWRHIVFCGDKSLIGTDYMLDDHGFNLESFRGTPLLFDALHNRGESRFRRLRGWGEVTEFFRAELARGQNATV